MSDFRGEQQYEQLTAFSIRGIEIAGALGIPNDREGDYQPYVTVYYDQPVTFRLDDPYSMLGLTVTREGVTSAENDYIPDDAIPLPFRPLPDRTQFWGKPVREADFTDNEGTYTGFVLFCGGTAVGGSADLLYVTASYDDIALGTRLIPLEAITRIDVHDERERKFQFAWQTVGLEHYRIPLLMYDGTVVLDRIPSNEEYLEFSEMFAQLPKKMAYVRDSLEYDYAHV